MLQEVKKFWKRMKKICVGKNLYSGRHRFIYNEEQAGIQIGRWKFEIYENRLAGPSFRVVALERNIVEHNIIKLG